MQQQGCEVPAGGFISSHFLPSLSCNQTLAGFIERYENCEHETLESEFRGQHILLTTTARRSSWSTAFRSLDFLSLPHLSERTLLLLRGHDGATLPGITSRIRFNRRPHYM